MPRFEFIKTEYAYTIKGTILQDDGTPNRLALVVLHDVTLGFENSRRSTNKYGEYEFEIRLDQLTPGQYEIRIYGSGDTDVNVYPFEIVSASGPASAYITSSGGNIFKYSETGYDPANVELEIHVSGVESPTYLWYLNGVTTGVISVTYSPALATIFATKDYAEVTCHTQGTNLEGVSVPEIVAAITLSKIENGIIGPGLVYCGIYNSSLIYHKTDKRVDIVSYDNGSGYLYYLCKVEGATGIWDVSKWELFAATFSSIATGLLLSEDVVVIRTFTIGQLDSANFGIIRSANATDISTGNGFYLSANNTESYFRVGSATQYLKWDNTNLTIVSNNFNLTAAGSLWAAAGGFGGASYATPIVNITAAGLTVADANTTARVFIEYTAGIWREPRGVSVNKITNPGFDGASWGTAPNIWAHSNATFGYGNTAPGNTVPYCNFTATSGYVSWNHASTIGVLYTFTFWGIQFNTGNNNVLKVTVYEAGVSKKTVNFGASGGWAQYTVTYVPEATCTVTWKVEQIYAYDAAHLVAVDGFSLVEDDYFTSISDSGIFIYGMKDNYIKIGKGIFEIKGNDVQLTSLSVNGSATITGDLNVSGSIISLGTATSLAATTATTFTIGSAETSASTILQFGAYGTVNTLTSNGTKITSSVPLYINTNPVFSTVTRELYTAVAAILTGIPIEIPNGKSYITGSNKLLVFLDGRLQNSGISADYYEVNSTQIAFNFNLSAGANIVFIIIG